MRATQLVRYKDIGMLLVKHGRAGSRDEPRTEAERAALREDATTLARDLEDLGPTFVKLGQLLSTRSDLLPPEYLEALARLQDDVAPISFGVIEETVSRELGVRISKAFQSFDDVPLASASLGQVHRAVLRSGEQVAVKVQRPDIREGIVEDMDAIAKMAQLADDHTATGRQLGFADMVAEFRRSLMAELDYRQEAANLRLLGEQLEGHSRIVVPQPVDDYTTDCVLTMQYVAGRNISAIGPLGLMELDGRALADELFSAYLDQILLHGFFHADPHPGNVLVTDDGRLALLDLGMVARLEPGLQDELIKLLLAVSNGRGGDAAQVAIRMGRKLDDFDRDQFTRGCADLVLQNQGSTLGEMQAGTMVGELTRLAGSCGLRLPSELTMLGKALLNLDDIARTLDPTFDPNAAIQREAGELMRRKLLQTATPASMMSAAMEAKEFAEQLPGRVNRVMDALSEGKLTLNVQGIDERDVMRSFQKLANRVTAGLVVASLIIGAALIMRIETSTTLFGYPALAIVLFLIAAGAGLWLLVSIQLSDLPQRRGRDR